MERERQKRETRALNRQFGNSRVTLSRDETTIKLGLRDFVIANH